MHRELQAALRSDTLIWQHPPRGETGRCPPFYGVALGQGGGQEG